MNEVYDRTPVITIELQLRPYVPDEAEPYWYLDHVLVFRVHGRPVWEARIPEAERSTGRTAYVKRVHGSGWVLVLTLMHDKAKELLDHLALSHFAGAWDATTDKGHGHASRWSYWGHDESDPALSDPLIPLETRRLGADENT